MKVAVRRSIDSQNCWKVLLKLLAPETFEKNHGWKELSTQKIIGNLNCLVTSLSNDENGLYFTGHFQSY